MTKTSFCLFTTIRTPLAETLAFVHYHLNIGVDKIFLFFDDPGDPAAEALKQERRVVCTRCDQGYWADLAEGLPPSVLTINVKQKLNSQVALKKAREEGYEWICHIDGDELLHAPGGFKPAIASLPPDVLVAKLPVLEAIPADHAVQSAFNELFYFKNAPIVLPKRRYYYLDRRETIPFFLEDVLYRAKIIRARLRGCRQVSGEYIKAHVLGKSIARTSAPIGWFYSHFPIPAGARRLKLDLFPAVKVLHYDTPDYDHWKAKWNRRHQHSQASLKPTYLGSHRKQQYYEFVRVYEQGGEAGLAALFTSKYLVPARERGFLQKIGLVSEIHLPPEWFDNPPGAG